MSWPANPIDGQQVTINGVLYQYDATPGVWNRVGSGVSSVAVDSFTAANLTVTNLASLGDVGNVRISGGNAGYSLVTDGEGNLSWAGLGNAVTPGGSNTQVQYNDDGNFQGSANFTFNSSTETLSVTKIVGNGSGLTNLNGANVTGVVPNANFASNSNFATTAGNVRICFKRGEPAIHSFHQTHSIISGRIHGCGQSFAANVNRDRSPPN